MILPGNEKLVLAPYHTYYPSLEEHLQGPWGIPIEPNLWNDPLVLGKRMFGAWYINRPFPISKNPHSKNGSRCKTFLVKMSFICMIIKNPFHKKGFILGLVLKQRLAAFRKWPIVTVILNIPVIKSVV